MVYGDEQGAGAAICALSRNVTTIIPVYCNASMGITRAEVSGSGGHCSYDCIASLEYLQLAGVDVFVACVNQHVMAECG